MRFLKSRHLVYLVLALLVVELVFRSGLYEPVVSPSSHSGTTITLKKAVRAFGGKQGKVVTFGDSRAGQGLDNRRIYEAGQAYQLDHLKLSMAGSHFMTFKALASWSFDELDELRGIVIALSPAAFALRGNGAYELAKVAPLRDYIGVTDMFRHVPFRRADVRTFAPLFSVAAYRDDIRDLLANPGGRYAAVRNRNARSAMSTLAHTSTHSNDICYVPTDDAEYCLRVLRDAGDEIPDRARHGLENLCKAALKKTKPSKPGPAAGALVDEWMSYLEYLSARVPVMLVILPDHSVYRDYQYRASAAVVTNAVVARSAASGVAHVVDFRDLVVRQEARECGYYMDHVHLNQAGKQLLTDALLPELEKFWASLPGSAQPAAY